MEQLLNCIKLGDTQSLVQLAIGLNGAYLAFRVANTHVNERILNKINRTSVILRKLKKLDFRVEFIGIRIRYKKAEHYYNKYYTQLDKFMLMYGHGMVFMLSLFLLFSTLESEKTISYVLVWIIFISSYTPAFVAMFLEVSYRFRFSSTDKDLDNLTRKIIVSIQSQGGSVEDA